MSAFDTLLQWFSCILDPMKEFRIHAVNLADVHQNAMQGFNAATSPLISDNREPLTQNTFTGEFAHSFLDAVETFRYLERDLSDAYQLIGRLQELAASFETCETQILLDVGIAADEIEGESMLLTVTEAVDGAAIVEGGANPIADVAAIVLTIIEGATLLYTLEQLGENVYHDVQRLLKDLATIGDSVLPATAPEPKGNANPPTVNNKPVDQGVLQTLENKYPQIPKATLEGLLKRGLSQDDATYILDRLTQTGATNSDIVTFLNGFLISGADIGHMEKGKWIPDRIMSYFKGRHTTTLKQLVEDYAQVADIPGIQRVLGSIIAAPSDDARRGYTYELAWMKAHKDEIARVEDKENGLSAADVIIKSGFFARGSVIDLKSYTWVKYVDNKPVPVYTDSRIQQRFDNDWSLQIKRYRRLYGDKYPIVYCFDTTTSGKLPDKVIKVLTDAGVTVTTWPDVKTYYPPHDPTQSTSGQGNNDRNPIVIPGSNSGPNQLPGPGDGPNQLPGPGDGPLQLPAPGE